MYNKIMILGNLTKNIELKYASNGLAIANSSLASNRRYKDKEEVMYIDITLFGRSAEIANQYLCKGSKIFIEGRLQLEQWSDKQGQRKSKHSVIVETIQMLDKKSESTSPAIQQPPYQENYSTQNSYSATASAPIDNRIKEIDIDDDTFPF